MKSPTLPPISVPRLKSLLHRLQKTPAPKGELPYLDQLMIFLEAPPDGVTDRWKAGAKMCAAWGITCSGTSVWRLFCSYGGEWRVRVELERNAIQDEPVEALRKRAEHLIALRTYEILANPDTSHEALLALARLGVRRVAHNFARKKYHDHKRYATEPMSVATENRGRNQAEVLANTSHTDNSPIFFR